MMVKGVKIFPCVAVAIGPCICECVIYRSKPIPVALVAMAEWRNGFFFLFLYLFVVHILAVQYCRRREKQTEDKTQNSVTT
jgi:uncharacterized protein YybS (DUF2232 family)